jgi:hypothetical protein
MDYFELVDTIECALCELTGEQVYGLFTRWPGTQMLDDDFCGYLLHDFYKYLVGEGIIEDEEEEEEEEE